MKDALVIVKPFMSKPILKLKSKFSLLKKSGIWLYFPVLARVKKLSCFTIVTFWRKRMKTLGTHLNIRLQIEIFFVIS